MANVKQFDMKKGECFEFGSNQEIIKIGLGWDYESGTQPLDLDVSCVIFDKDSNIIDVVYFNKLQALNGYVRHSGDNRNGEGDGDDEVITVSLDKLPKHVYKLIFVINMYSVEKTFRDVKTAYCRVFEIQGEICRYYMSDFLNSEALIAAQIYFGDTGWEVQALGIPASGRTFKESLEKIQEVARADRSVEKIQEVARADTSAVHNDGGKKGAGWLRIIYYLIWGIIILFFTCSH
eukprot:GHVP01063998.1.p1 GENE.GHVP01063998.1~~GHVP01063998.1.p1  ORF type:complete len:235 (+),score=22.24 GHVP01063998.1:253-957(+)